MFDWFFELRVTMAETCGYLNIFNVNNTIDEHFSDDKQYFEHQRAEGNVHLSIFE